MALLSHERNENLFLENEAKCITFPAFHFQWRTYAGKYRKVEQLSHRKRVYVFDEICLRLRCYDENVFTFNLPTIFPACMAATHTHARTNKNQMFFCSIVSLHRNAPCTVD
ncbi:hypothetical protein KP509_1Z011700 [Ceratopteris richardii]|nr:hypothetical protein KP509_1Z011700 [Ceratopteris richardii]